MKTWAAIVAVLAAVLSTSTPGAPVGESGTELWVDGPVADEVGMSPQTPDATADHRGRQIYVWDNSPTGGGSGIDVFLRVFDASGNSLLGPVKVNTTVADNQRYAQIAVSADGSFLVIWQSFEPADGLPGVFYPAVRSQLFDADGIPVGSEQLLNTSSTDLQTSAHANVAALTGGGYVTAWESLNSTAPNTGLYSIQARLVGANGVPSGSQFQINSLDSGLVEQYPAVAGLADGGFIATWNAPQIQARRFMADGTPVGNDFQVNSMVGLAFRDQPDVAVNADGRVLFVWRDDEEGPSEEIRGRMFGPTLSAQGADFRINTYVTGAQTDPQVAAYGPAGFFVVWESFGSPGADADPYSIEGRIVNGANSFAGPQFLVNEYTNNSQEDPGIGGRNGLVAVAWMGRENAEVMGQVIMGQLWNICGIFCDSFE